ncbi:hypothetical protein CS063_06585 [Sporanaerobium hydrogeniformans]|uniref:Uncharacterized protein n=1 Tax=Sporanaerobium hydrogeniformans TaxID=3072179 RepID=A0AC61DDH2_9FIRM|nr:hypothetical protein CS063_06585 [Sporanaerobium hydrogeniformans]
MIIQCIDLKKAPNLGIISLVKTKSYKKSAKLMINHNTSYDHIENQFANAIKELGVGKMLWKVTIRKPSEVPAY